jgi:glutathione S-transferase
VNLLLDEQVMVNSAWLEFILTSLITDYETFFLQKSVDYTAINPMQELPTLIIDGHKLTQSLAILEYLEETRTDRPLLPSDPIARAKVSIDGLRHE